MNSVCVCSVESSSAHRSRHNFSGRFLVCVNLSSNFLSLFPLFQTAYYSVLIKPKQHFAKCRKVSDNPVKKNPVAAILQTFVKREAREQKTENVANVVIRFFTDDFTHCGIKLPFA